MKIGDIKDTAAQIIQQYQRGESLNPPADKQAGPGVAAEEKVDLSTRARDIQLAQKAVANLPDMREEKVRELKAQIEKGTYQIDSDKVAQKIVRDSLIDLFT